MLCCGGPGTLMQAKGTDAKKRGEAMQDAPGEIEIRDPEGALLPDFVHAIVLALDEGKVDYAMIREWLARVRTPLYED